jgi:hypothetical protein
MTPVMTSGSTTPMPTLALKANKVDANSGLLPSPAAEADPQPGVAPGLKEK